MNYPLSIQWHITANCQNHCKHCYMFDPATIRHGKTHPLSFAEKLLVMDQLDAFGEKWGFYFPNVCLIGGDPLLADDMFPFIEDLNERGKIVSLEGNPESLTEENCSRLRALGVSRYQLRLDGLRDTHDKTRSPGSFDRTLAAYTRLKHYGLRGTTMATLTPLNIDEFFELIDFVFYHTDSTGFSFDFVSPVGNGTQSDTSFTPEEVLALSRRYLSLKERYRKINPDFEFDEKPGIFRLLHLAEGTFSQLADADTHFEAGCLIRNASIPILSDGTILFCRRFPEILGHLPKDSFEEIFLQNETLKKYRRPQFFPKCGNCIGWNICRGCSAVSFGECKDSHKSYRICYANLLPIETTVPHNAIPMNTTMEEEADLIKHNLQYQHCELTQ